jgi:hypothetical protein
VHIDHSCSKIAEAAGNVFEMTDSQCDMNDFANARTQETNTEMHQAGGAMRWKPGGYTFLKRDITASQAMWLSLPV